MKHNNFVLYAHCLHLMSDLFFSFDGQNYAKYLTYFSTFIANIEMSHPGATTLFRHPKWYWGCCNCGYIKPLNISVFANKSSAVPMLYETGVSGYLINSFRLSYSPWFWDFINSWKATFPCCLYCTTLFIIIVTYAFLYILRFQIEVLGWLKDILFDIHRYSSPRLENKHFV